MVLSVVKLKVYPGLVEIAKIIDSGMIKNSELSCEENLELEELLEDRNHLLLSIFSD